MQLTLPPQTRYDQAARFLLHRTGALFFQWLLRLTPAQLHFERWRPATLTLPGVADRLCDGIAELADLARGGLPFAALLEVQTIPDATMPGRLMLAGGIVWLTIKPAPLPGDRFELLGVVINLTGVGDGSRDCVLSTARWTLKPVELNMETLDAGWVLEEIATGRAPRELLAFIPLMNRGGEDAIIGRWRKIVGADPQERGNFVLALVFAERVGRLAVWEKAMEDLILVESPLIAKLLAEHGAKVEAKAEAKGETKGKIEGKIEALLRIVRRWSQPLPEDLLATIRACIDGDKLDRWLDDALDAGTLDKFRQKTGL